MNEENKKELEEGYKKEKTSGSGTTYGYTVEVRVGSMTEPKIIAGSIVSRQWGQLNLDKGETIGVPAKKRDFGMFEHGLMSHNQAQAMRYWFEAIADNESSWGSIETRLVCHSYNYSYKVEAVSYED